MAHLFHGHAVAPGCGKGTARAVGEFNPNIGFRVPDFARPMRAEIMKHGWGSELLQERYAVKFSSLNPHAASAWAEAACRPQVVAMRTCRATGYYEEVFSDGSWRRRDALGVVAGVIEEHAPIPGKSLFLCYL